MGDHDIVEIGPGMGWAYRWQVENNWEIDWEWFDEMVAEDEAQRKAEEAAEAERKANLLIDFDEMPDTAVKPALVETKTVSKFENELLDLFSSPPKQATATTDDSDEVDLWGIGSPDIVITADSGSDSDEWGDFQGSLADGDDDEWGDFVAG